jgi:hypothetical protein
VTGAVAVAATGLGAGVDPAATGSTALGPAGVAADGTGTEGVPDTVEVSGTVVASVGSASVAVAPSGAGPARRDVLPSDPALVPPSSPVRAPAAASMDEEGGDGTTAPVVGGAVDGADDARAGADRTAPASTGASTGAMPAAVGTASA